MIDERAIELYALLAEYARTEGTQHIHTMTVAELAYDIETTTPGIPAKDRDLIVTVFGRA